MPDQSDGGIRERRAHPELAAEQAYLDRAYGRLDEMRKAAIRVAEGYADVRRGGTHQARLERDAAAAHTRRRLAALNIGNAPLCFGRIDLEARPGEDGPEHPDDDRFYIGRISVTEADQTPLIVDWRAPVAEPFYRATGVEPMGVVRRRHFQTQGRELLGIDDEVFDSTAADEAGFTIVGEAALLAALDRHRTGRMGDIVATIQAEQDEAVRAPLSGILVVAGGPGTGKTAVALHRAAYLLYTHRQRLASRGVLVGPSPIFLRYIDEVLPSLGEEDVQLTTVAGLKPQLRARAPERPAIAALKGDARMAQVIARALRDRERPLRKDLSVMLDGHVLRLRRADSARIVERVRRRRGTHNERRPAVTRLVLDHLREQYRRSLVAAYERDVRRIDPEAELSLSRPEEGELLDVPVAAALARGERAPDDWEAELSNRLRRMPEVRAALERMWPVLSGAELVHDLFSFSALIRSAANGVLTRDEHQLLARPRSSSVRDVAWTQADVALVDEADALLGPPEAGRPRRRRRRRAASDRALEDAARVVEELGLGSYTTAAEVVERYGGPERASPRRPPVGVRRWRRAERRRGGGAAHVRARARRRGAGPHRDAVAHGGQALSVGIDDARRRLRPVEPAGGLARLGRGARAAPGRRARPRRRALGELPHTVGDHGSRRPRRGRVGARGAPGAVGAQHGATAAVRRRRRPGRSRHARRRDGAQRQRRERHDGRDRAARPAP